ncbi:MAG: peptidoglycan DD-metalloendopeptidase family protein [Christensenellales bacterium]|jgi:murein DD-endopeptidase MepM/ murein hydrolase activator NlpD
MNIKDKIFKKINKQSLKLFFQRQGLYVLIFLCIVAAGITAIVAWPRDNTDEQQISDSGTDAAVIEAPTLEEELAANATQSPSPTPTAEPTGTPIAASKGSGKITLKKPVQGQIINKFSGDELVYYASLNIWETHNGVDIKGDKGESVAAALSGTVSEAYSNEADGGVVVINHSDTAKTVYVGLGDITVKKDDKVNSGQKIGEIGELPKELDLGYHVHFEYIVNNQWKDPSKYF